MNFITDDATELSAFGNDTIKACIDKGLIDALFCTEDYEACELVLKAVHRVLEPGGSLVCFSFSRPEFLVSPIVRPNLQWQSAQVQELSSILLYQFQKGHQPDDDGPPKISKPRSNKNSNNNNNRKQQKKRRQ